MAPICTNGHQLEAGQSWCRKCSALLKREMSEPEAVAAHQDMARKAAVAPPVEDKDLAAAKRFRTVITVLFCLGGAIALYVGHEIEEEKNRPPLMPCLYDPNTGEPFNTPCDK